MHCNSKLLHIIKYYYKVLLRDIKKLKILKENLIKAVIKRLVYTLETGYITTDLTTCYEQVT